MKLRDIISTAATIAGTLNPAVGAAIAVVNNFLPDDKKLPETATGKDVGDAVAKLPPEQQSSLLEKEIDLEIKLDEGWTERYKAMCSADGQETRAKIVMGMAQVLVAEILIFTGTIAYDPSILENTAAWTVFGVLTATPTTVILNYFGNLRKEHAQRQITAGADTKAISSLGVLSKLLPWNK